ncbi:hypothetical protein HZA87_06205, partial [Candidatus Uhrbacteria bacterium]|nr:hypothetical protein [Candidatus Uhrbacteria bacterium]
FCLAGIAFIWLTRRSRSTPSRVRPLIVAARTVIAKDPKRWRKVASAAFDTDLEFGTFQFCTADCAWKGRFEAKGQAAALTFEQDSGEVELVFHGGQLIGASLGEELFRAEDPEVRCNEPLARNLLDEVRKAVGFSALEKSTEPKVYSKSIPKKKDKDDRDESTQKQPKRRKRE